MPTPRTIATFPGRGRLQPLLAERGLSHHVPLRVLTAYTPYQPELSQGTLQQIYEFQTLICQLTGMDVANASMYDAGSALGEAAIMARPSPSANKVRISARATRSTRPCCKHLQRLAMASRCWSTTRTSPSQGAWRATSPA